MDEYTLISFILLNGWIHTNFILLDKWMKDYFYIEYLRDSMLSLWEQRCESYRLGFFSQRLNNRRFVLRYLAGWTNIFNFQHITLQQHQTLRRGGSFYVGGRAEVCPANTIDSCFKNIHLFCSLFERLYSTFHNGSFSTNLLVRVARRKLWTK